MLISLSMLGKFLLLLFLLSPIILPLYTLYLLLCDPWSAKEKRKELHEMSGFEWIETDDGSMSIGHEEGIIYFFKRDW